MKSNVRMLAGVELIWRITVCSASAKGRGMPFAIYDPIGSTPTRKQR